MFVSTTAKNSENGTTIDRSSCIDGGNGITMDSNSYINNKNYYQKNCIYR